MFSLHSHVNQMPHIWHRARACHVIWLPGEARQICVNVLQWYTLDAQLLKATCYQVAEKTVLGFWTALSEVIQCQTPSYHDSTCGEVGLRYGVKVLRHSHLYIVPFCRTCAMTGMRAALSCMYLHTVSDVKRRNFSRAVKLFVEKPH